VCLVVDCPEVEVRNGMARITGKGPGSKLLLECQNGASLVGGVVQECLFNGSWSGEIGKCVMGRY